MSSLGMRPTREQLAHHFLPQYGEADLADLGRRARKLLEASSKPSTEKLF